MHCKKPLSVAIACVLFMLSGCDRSTESGNYRLNISPSLGMVKNATVRVYADDGRTLVGKGTTGSTGVAGMFIGGYQGPLVISIQGDNDATYFDEHLGYEVSFPAGYSMRVLANNTSGNYGVSPLTELAYRIAVDEGLFPLSVYEVNTLNERVRRTLAPELDSITRPMTIVDAVLLTSLAALPLEERLVDTMSNRYALRLAAMADLAEGYERPALTVMEYLGIDILDDRNDNIKAGKIDSRDKYGTPLATPYKYVSIIEDLNEALYLRALDFAAPDLFDAVANYDIDLTGGTVIKLVGGTVINLVGGTVTNIVSLDGTVINLVGGSVINLVGSNLVGSTVIINLVGGTAVTESRVANIDLDILDDGSNFTGCDNTAPVLLPPELAGRVQYLRFENIDASAPFSRNEIVLFTFCANGQLRMTNNYFPISSAPTVEIIEEELTDPLDPSSLVIVSAKYIWRQNSNGMVYELVVLDKTLYEMNIYGERGALYYGRFVP